MARPRQAEKKQPIDRKKLVKISVLARQSGLPAATIKHWVREGLVSAAAKTGRTMSWYDVGLVPRLRAIKEIQRRRYLPLRVIREILESGHDITDDATAAAAIQRALEKTASRDKRTQAQLMAAGVGPDQLAWMKVSGIITPVTEGGQEIYTGDDLELLRVLGAARRQGLTTEMLPFSILDTYAKAIGELVRAELKIFRSGVLPKAGGDLGELSETATMLSERLVVLVRRKMLVPTLKRLVAEEAKARQKR
jgi:DNA-binding transcriptional MerR regulator